MPTLAATLSPTYGVYSGFELYEHVAVRPGSEEYLDSEKYQYRPRDWELARKQGRTLAPYLTVLNTIRREHPALQDLRSLRFHACDNNDVIAFSKVDGDDIVLVVCTLDPDREHEATVWWDLAALGLPEGERFVRPRPRRGRHLDVGTQHVRAPATMGPRRPRRAHSPFLTPAPPT